MDTLYERGLAPLPKSENKEKLVRRYHEQFHWPLTAAMLLLLAEMFLPERKKSKVQKSLQTATKSKVETPAIVALIAILLLPVAAKASLAGALRDYKSGQLHERAVGIFTAGGNPDERPAAGFQRGRGGVSRDEF